MVSVTGTYIDTTDLVNMFGESNLTEWADLESEGDTDVMTARLTDAIAFGEGAVEDAFRGTRVTVPFQVSGASLNVLKAFMAAQAASWLRNSRPLATNEQDHISVMMDAMDQLMREYQSGRRIFTGGCGNTYDEARIGLVE